MTDKAVDGTEKGIFKVGETFLYRIRIENDVGTDTTPELKVVFELPPELEFLQGQAINSNATVTGEGQKAATSNFVLPVRGAIDFDIQVRVLSAPPSQLTRVEARILRAVDVLLEIFNPFRFGFFIRRDLPAGLPLMAVAADHTVIDTPFLPVSLCFGLRQW